jgi:hypothetical protein
VVQTEDDDVDEHDDGIAASWTLVGGSDDEDEEGGAAEDAVLIDLPDLAVGSASALEEKKAGAVIWKVRSYRLNKLIMDSC